MTRCPACLREFREGDFSALANHFVEEAQKSEAAHVRWLNQNASRDQLPAEELERRLRHFFDCPHGALKQWIKSRFIEKFYGPKPHPFVVALQHPSRAVLLGYTIEHQHFLRQWVRSCAYITARTDETDVVRYELENLNTEFGGFGRNRVSHYELLIRMGQSLGVSRSQILSTPPLPSTSYAIAAWNEIASQLPWLDAMAAMHSLELIANRNLVKEGASVPYFDPAILKGSEIPKAAQEFLREGYEADVAHSDEAIDLVAKFATSRGAVESIQSTFLRSIDLFDDYLLARLERADQFEDR